MRYREAWLGFGWRVWNRQGPSQVYESTWIAGDRQLTKFKRRPLPALGKLNSLVVQECSFVQVCVAQEQNQKHGQTHWWAMGLSFSFKQIGRWQKTKHAHASQTEIGQMCETTRFIRGMGESAVKVNWELGFNSLRGWVTNMYTEDWGNTPWLTAHPSEFSHYLLGKK